MKTFSRVLPFLVTAAVSLAPACRDSDHDHDQNAGHHGEAAVMSESRVKRAADGRVTVTLDAATQQRVGLKTALPQPATLNPEVKAYGRVLDPGPLGALISEVVNAQTAVETSQKEFQRVKSLHAQGTNAPKRAVEAAEAAFRRDEVALDNARMKVMTTWGRAFLPGPGLPQLLEPLVSQQSALVRLDLPAGESATAPRSARLFALAHSDRPIAAEFLAPAVDVDAQAQSQGFLFLVRSNTAQLRPGQALMGAIQQAGEVLRGWMVPPSAVIRTGGKAWVYAQSDATTFARREIPLDHPTEQGWVVTAGLDERQPLVVTGAQTLFSEELKSRIQIGE